MLVALIVILALAARLIPGPRTIDDAYITFRYARNLLAGNGFVFNPGERVLGTTTPLFTLILAAAALPFGGSAAPFPGIAFAIATLFDLGAWDQAGYWARLKATDGIVSSIVANGLPRGPFVLTVVESDKAVELRGVELTAR